MNSCGFHRLAPPCGEGRNPRRCLNAKGRRRCCVGCERFFAIDAFAFDVLTEFALCGAARRANAQRNRSPLSPFRSVNPIAPIGGACWIPLVCMSVLEHVTCLSYSAVQRGTSFPPYRRCRCCRDDITGGCRSVLCYIKVFIHKLAFFAGVSGG